MTGKYKIGFDVGGLIVFLIIMIPNFIWFALPAPNDILRRESVTEIIDAAGSLFQILTVASLCLLIRKERPPRRFSGYIIAALCCVLAYSVGWVLYYNGFVNSFVIAALTLPPCLALLFYAADRKNFIAVISGLIFTACHVIYAIVNFII